MKRHSVNFSIVASILTVFCALAQANAQIVYVDAADGASYQGTTVSFIQGNPLNGVVTVMGNISGTMIDQLFVDVAVMLK